MITRLELDRCQVLVRTDFIVLTAPGLDHDARLGAAAEPLEQQKLVAELAVKAFIGSLLPGFCLGRSAQAPVQEEFSA